MTYLYSEENFIYHMNHIMMVDSHIQSALKAEQEIDSYEFSGHEEEELYLEIVFLIVVARRIEEGLEYNKARRKWINQYWKAYRHSKYYDSASDLYKYDPSTFWELYEKFTR